MCSATLKNNIFPTISKHQHLQHPTQVKPSNHKTKPEEVFWANYFFPPFCCLADLFCTSFTFDQKSNLVTQHNELRHFSVAMDFDELDELEVFDRVWWGLRSEWFGWIKFPFSNMQRVHSNSISFWIRITANYQVQFAAGLPWQSWQKSLKILYPPSLPAAVMNTPSPERMKFHRMLQCCLF